MSIQALLLYKIIKENDIETFKKLKEDFFTGIDKKIYKEIYDYFTSYGKLPPKITQENEYVFTEEDFQIEIDFLYKKTKEKFSEYLKFKFQEELNKLDSEFEKDKLLQTLALELYKFWNEDNINTMTYSSYLENLEMKYNKLLTEGKTGIATGYKSFDNITGGLLPCEIYLVLGRIKQGKSQLLISITNNIIEQGYKTLFISMEMTQSQIYDRLLGIKLGVNPKVYRLGQISPFALEKLKEITINNLKVIEGQFKSTLAEITTLAMIEKPEVLVIDGAYLIKLGTKQENYMSKPEILEEIMKGLKHIAHSLKIPILASFQFKRETSRIGNFKQGVEAIDRIQWSDAIGQIMTSGLAIYDDKDNPDRKLVEILRGRHGEDGEFYIHWDFDRGNFKEIEEASLIQDDILILEE
jgi:replicative DNA helicase